MPKRVLFPIMEKIEIKSVQARYLNAVFYARHLKVNPVQLGKHTKRMSLNQRINTVKRFILKLVAIITTIRIKNLMLISVRNFNKILCTVNQTSFK